MIEDILAEVLSNDSGCSEKDDSELLNNILGEYEKNEVIREDTENEHDEDILESDTESAELESREDTYHENTELNHEHENQAAEEFSGNESSPESYAPAKMSKQETEQELYWEKRTATRNIVVAAILALLAGYLELTKYFPAAAPSFLDVNQNPTIFCIANLALLLTAVLFMGNSVINGIISVFTFRPNRNSLSSVSAVIAFVQVLCFTLNADCMYDPNVHLYTLVAVTGLLFNAVSARIQAVSKLITYRVASSDYDKYALKIVDEQHAMQYTKGLLDDIPTLCVNQKINSISDFYSVSGKADITERFSRIISPLVLIFSVLIGAATGVIMNSFYVGLTVAAAIACVCSPFSYLLAAALPKLRAAKRLIMHGAAMINSCGTEDYSFVNSVVLSAKQLFDEASVTLYGINTFGSARIDDAILDAASLAVRGESILADLFLQIISGKTNMLKKVTGIEYEDNMGLSAWVENKRVLIGNRDLMLARGVDVPQKEYETKYHAQKRELVYLSIAGELAAVFVIALKCGDEAKSAVRMITKKGIGIVVNSSDAMLTAEKLEELFGEDRYAFKIMPARLRDNLSDITEPCEYTDIPIINNGRILSVAHSLCEAQRHKSVVMIGMIIQLAALIAGFAIIAVFTFMRDFSQLNELMILLCQGIWLVLSLFLK